MLPLSLDHHIHEDDEDDEGDEGDEDETLRLGAGGRSLVMGHAVCGRAEPCRADQKRLAPASIAGERQPLRRGPGPVAERVGGRRHQLLKAGAGRPRHAKPAGGFQPDKSVQGGPQEPHGVD